MTREVPESHPLHRLFRGLTESTFLTELGIGDPFVGPASQRVVERCLLDRQEPLHGAFRPGR